MAGFDVLVVGTAIEHHVAFADGFAGIGVVGDFIRVKDVGAVVDFNVAAQFVDRAVLFLL